MFATVPNMLSIHRRLGVAMDLIDSVYDASERNQRFHQPGRFDLLSLKQLVTDFGWRVIEVEGFFLKPFPHDVMERLFPSQDLLEGLFVLGRQYPELASQILIVAEVEERKM